MRKGLAAALVALLAISAIGEEPLPPVQPLEPQHDVSIVTLADAAQHNDYGTFVYLYDRRPDAAFADLYELWKYAQTERFGGWYDAEMHDRLVRRYPGLAAYLEPYRIVDRNGNVFYPTSETRTFLLRQATGGVRPSAQPIRVASVEGTKARPAAKAKPQRKVESRVGPAAAKPHPRLKKASVTPKPRPTTVATTTTQPVVRQAPPAVQPAPPVATAKPSAVAVAPPKPVAVASPKPAAVAPPKPVAVAPPKPVAVATPAPAPARTPAPAPVPARPPAQVSDGAMTARGILLMILGLLGIGVLTMMLRTPAADREGEPEEEQMPTVPTLKLTKLPEPPDEDHRATGSHG